MHASGEGNGTALRWWRGERGMRTERASQHQSSGVRAGPERNGETLQGFERGRAPIGVSARRTEVTMWAVATPWGGAPVITLVWSGDQEPEPREGQSVGTGRTAVTP